MKGYNRFTKLFLAGLASIVLFSGCGNPSTPAGYMGYEKRGAVVGKESFYGMQTGPTSTGLGWLLSATNFSITPYTYHEPMEVLSRDNLKVKFQVHIIWRVRPTHEDGKMFIEKYSVLLSDTLSSTSDKIVQAAYNNFLKEPLRTAARDEVQGQDALQLKEKIIVMGRSIEASMKVWVSGTPFDIMSIVVGDIQYPEEVEAAVAKKMAATQLLEQKGTDI